MRKSASIFSSGFPWRAQWGAIRALEGVWTRLAKGLVWPYVELLLRVWVAKLFFTFGLQQLMHWDITLGVAEQQNPLPFLAPVAAGYASTILYLSCSILLALGFMTRYASLPLLIIAAIAQVRLDPFDTQLFWMALFTWFCIHGAGPISLDQLLRRGLSNSAIPIVPAAIRVSTWLRRSGTGWLLTGGLGSVPHSSRRPLGAGQARSAGCPWM